MLMVDLLRFLEGGKVIRWSRWDGCVYDVAGKSLFYSVR